MLLFVYVFLINIHNWKKVFNFIFEVFEKVGKSLFFSSEMGTNPELDNFSQGLQITLFGISIYNT